MKRKLDLPLGKAADGFIQFKETEGLSKHTLFSYRHQLNVWLEYMHSDKIETDIAPVMTQ